MKNVKTAKVGKVLINCVVVINNQTEEIIDYYPARFRDTDRVMQRVMEDYAEQIDEKEVRIEQRKLSEEDIL